jgi:branched-chain amino acid transport system ATP-binding protein
MLSVSGISKSFGGFAVLRDVTLWVEQGTTHAIIGPNGAGKTTLINAISGLIKPDSGRLHLGEREITHEPAHRVARAGLVRTFQITSLFSELSVLDNLKVAQTAAERFRGSRAENSSAKELLARFGLERIARRLVSQLSHGDQRILEIAMALAASPIIILLDEPTAGMSPDETERFVDLVTDNLKGTYTLVLIEHDMDVVLRTADRITVLSAGAVLADDVPSAIMADPRVQEAYLGRARH